NLNQPNSNQLPNAQVLTLNRGTVNLSGTGAGTEVVAGLALGSGVNMIKRDDSSTAVLQLGAITRSAPGATLSVSNINVANTTTSNTSTGIMGAWAVVNYTDWAVSAAAANNTPITRYTYVDDGDTGGDPNY